MSFPIKFVVLLTFAIPVLAAFGVSEWFKQPKACAKLGLVAWLFSTGVIGIILAFDHRHPEHFEVWRTVAWNGLGRIFFLTIALGVFWFLVRTTRTRLQTLLGLGLIVVLWLDVVTHAPNQNPTVKPAIYTLNLQTSRWKELPPIPGESRAMLSDQALKKFEHSYLADTFNTVLGYRLSLFANCNLIDGVPKIDGFYSVYLREQSRLLFFLYRPEGQYAQGLADFMGASQISAPGKYLDWQSRPSYRPLITGGQQTVFADTNSTLTGLFSTNFDSRQSVFLPLEAKKFIAATNLATVKFLSRRFTAQRIDIELETDRPAMVVIAQSFYHRWRAAVDEKPTRLWRANQAFQALEVPAGRHRVRLAYVDHVFRLGAVISAATFFVCLIAITINWKKKLSRRGDGSFPRAA